MVVAGGGFSFDWGLVQQDVARFARICTYDASGTAWSDANPGTKGGGAPGCAERVEELHRVLKKAPVDGPYVLAGFSIGGLYARLYAQMYPGEVAGMVIVDHAFLDPGGAPEGRAGGAGAAHSPAEVDSAPVLISQTPIVLEIEDDRNFARLPRSNREMHAWAMARQPARPTLEAAEGCRAAVRRAEGDGHPLGSRPLVVVSTANETPGYAELQKELLTLSRNSRQMMAAHSSHMVIVDEPGVVVSAMEEVVKAVRSGGALRK